MHLNSKLEFIKLLYLRCSSPLTPSSTNGFQQDKTAECHWEAKNQYLYAKKSLIYFLFQLIYQALLQFQLYQMVSENSSIGTVIEKDLINLEENQLLSGFGEEIRGVSFVENMALGFGDSNRALIWGVGNKCLHSLEIISPRESSFLFQDQKPKLLEVIADPQKCDRFALAYSNSKAIVSTLEKGVFNIQVMLSLQTRPNQEVSCLCFSHNSQALAIGTTEGRLTIYIFQEQSKEEEKNVCPILLKECSQSPIVAIDWDQDCQILRINLITSEILYFRALPHFQGQVGLIISNWDHID